MSEQSESDLRRIFEAVMDAPSEERDSVLVAACKDNRTLVARVRAIINAAEDRHFLNDPEFAAAPVPMLAAVYEEPGSVIGPFTIIRRLGEGGFGVVYLAQQSSPIRREVALKIVKAGMDTAQVLARFEQERQALALMEHPGIARVLDGGVTGSGRPYFVMEFVPGESLLTYADSKCLTIRERLDLFVLVCQAVHHAHLKGLIHRDLKPNNILVSAADGFPQPKIIDFGIAKATAGKLTDRTLHTEHKQLIGTPAYMSPEQAEGSMDIDIRSDIYSLGVILYELLSGSTPFDVDTLRSAGHGEWQRVIREVDPPKPSTRLRLSADTVAGVASHRNIEPKKLNTLLRGELDWIVMKAIEKDRIRRYQSAHALMLDVQRYLTGEAVIAAPISRTYQLRKFVRRHKGPVTAGTAVAISLCVGAAAFAWQANVALKERDRALRAEASTSQRAKELQEVSDFQAQMLTQLDPAAAGLRLTADVRARFESALAKSETPEAQRVSLVESFAEAWSRIGATDVALELIKANLFAPAIETIDRQFADQPALNATLRVAIAKRYLDLGLYDDALKAFESAIDLRKQTLGADHPDTLDAVLGKCKVLTLVGRAADAEAILRTVIDGQPYRLQREEPRYLSARELLGECMLVRNQSVQAEAVFRSSLADRRKVLGDDHEDTLQSMGNLGMALRAQGSFSDAEAITREAMERRLRLFGADSQQTITSFNNLAVILLDAGKAQEALEYFEMAAQSRRRILGEAHRDTLVAENNLAATLSRMSRHEEAEAIQRNLLGRIRKTLGPNHPDTLMVISNLASTLISLGKLQEAEPLCRESLERRVQVFGPTSGGAMTANNVMSFLLRRQGRDAEAEPYLQAALSISRTAWGDDHPERIVLLTNMGALKRTLGDTATSEQLYQDALERCVRTLGPDHPLTRIANQGLADTFMVQKRYAEAETVLSKAEASFRAAAAKDDQGELRVLLMVLGKAQAAQKKFASAEGYLKEAYERFVEARGPSAKGTQVCVAALSTLYTEWHELEPAAGHERQAEQWKARLIPVTSQPAPARSVVSQ